MIWLIGAGLWGAGEATFFFIVPDVLLTAAVLRFGLRRTFPLAAMTAATAALAGIGMWWWGNHDVAAARNAMLVVPAIGADLLAHAHDEMANNWPLNLFLGAVTGLPYKLYAVEAGALGVNPVLFVLVSFVARLPRLRRSGWPRLASCIGNLRCGRQAGSRYTRSISSSAASSENRAISTARARCADDAAARASRAADRQYLPGGWPAGSPDLRPAA